MTNIEELLNLGVPNFLGPQMPLFALVLSLIFWVYN
jgi:hypothetical protein